MRFLTVDEFRGKPLVSIREYYEKNGELLPGRKGKMISFSQFYLRLALLFAFDVSCFT
ncbi:hypothetical protein WDU94_012361 [Cyamophila willieti]